MWDIAPPNGLYIKCMCSSYTVRIPSLWCTTFEIMFAILPEVIKSQKLFHSEQHNLCGLNAFRRKITLVSGTHLSIDLIEFTL